MKKKKQISENYLDFIPVHCKNFECNAEIVTVFVENKGFFNHLAQKILKKPSISQIHLDTMGSFLWLQIDGKTTVYEIAQSVKKQFGEDAEPLYKRLLQYIRTLEDYGFIKVEKTKQKE